MRLANKSTLISFNRHWTRLRTDRRICLSLLPAPHPGLILGRHFSQSSYSYTKMDLETYSNKDQIKVIERFFELPLDYNDPNGETIRVFARNLIPKNKAKTEKEENDLPYLVYLQGGPGFEIDLMGSSGFAGETLWLDQRGTGLSTPISADTLPPRLKSDQDIANYLKHFRADSIVKDCESIRQILIGDKPNEEDRKWTIMGQSFGGFCSITYLSYHSQGLKEVFITGGLAPLVNLPDPNYELTVRQVVKRNKIYYAKYPKDVRDIAAYLEANSVILPGGGHLTVSRFQQLGIDFGMAGGIDRVHQLVLRVANDLELFGKLSFKCLQRIEQSQSFDGNPIYAILHEPIYCQGQAPRWSAHRIVQKFPQFFSWTHVKSLSSEEPIYFTGEMSCCLVMDPPESLEKIFLRVEEESQRRAQAEHPEDTGDPTKSTPLDTQTISVKARRRGSISVTRFGQLTDELTPKDPRPTSPPNSPTTFITTLAAQSTFYQSQILNHSRDSLGSHTSDNENGHAEDDNHVTQIHRIAARQTLSRTVGSLLPRRLSRARSRPVIEDVDGTMVIGVSVQAATALVEESYTPDSEVPIPQATVTTGGRRSLAPTLNSKPSKSSLRSITSNSNWVPSTNWVARAKEITRKLRRKSAQPLTQTS
ncbi:hypothetical protein D9757_006453 [Collybiopsis confluens]|uniref:AB hydrolase-1 domain-containing protein n=1 Tax=Collybiopsis confluens TaxID=2823264 RepID=A0A8H5HJ65_9AGAR|nr:hypothetical protein D9757_006453 [Collybiopsis confluens]